MFHRHVSEMYYVHQTTSQTHLRVCIGKSKWKTSSLPACPRTIVCCLSHWKQKESILINAHKLKPRGIFFNEDLAFETLQKRRAQVPQLIEAKKIWEGGVFYFGQINHS